MMPSYQRRKEGEIGLWDGSASLHEICVEIKTELRVNHNVT